MTGAMEAVQLDADAGTCRRIEGGWELRFERRLRHSPERVWAALTTGEGLACWLAEADIEATPGGRMELNFRQPDHDFMPDTPEKRRQSNEVLVARPFTRFEHTFGSHPESVVSWRLEPDGDGTHLTLIHRVPDSWAGARANVLSGWHHHMEGLDDAAHGVRHPWSWDRWFALRDAYAARVEGGGVTAPVARAGMLIRRPAAEVFEAFADPAVTSQFWFTRGSGRLEPGARVRWDWEMYGVGTDVRVKAVEPGRRILIDWDTADDPTEVEWLFEARGDETLVTIENRGFPDSPAGVARALDSTGGFNLVMAAAKFWLEHGIDPRIIEDAHAAQRRPDWKGRS